MHLLFCSTSRPYWPGSHMQLSCNQKQRQQQQQQAEQTTEAQCFDAAVMALGPCNLNARAAAP